MNNAQINILIFLLSSVGLIVLPHVANIPLLIFLFFYVMLAWRVIAIWRPHYLPKKNLLIALTIFSLLLLFSQHRAILGRDAGTNLFIVTLGLKLLETKSERDYYLVIYLSFIVAASLFLFQQSLLMAAYILAVCCVLFATLVAINSIEIKTSIALKTASIIVFQAIPLAIVIFILFPRIESPRWMIFKEKEKAKMGLSESMEPGSISDLSVSEELVFRVKFKDKIPPARERYWRGPVMSYTDGKRWRILNSQRYLSHLSPTNYQGSAYQYTLLMEAQEKNWVFALELPAQYDDHLDKNGNYQLTTTDNPNKRSEYHITSYPNYNTGALSSLEYQDNIQLPQNTSEKIKNLVQQLHGFENKPEIFIQQLLNYFKTEQFRYTLRPPEMINNPIENFLFEKRAGFCSHYATAFVYLMRVAGIPARVVTGYQGGNYNAMGDFLEIKQADAHAWAEVWLENKGWVRVDPTAAVAPERIEQSINIELLQLGAEVRFDTEKNKQQGLLAQAMQLWNSVDYQWQRWVVNYDTDNQADFLSSFGIHNIKTMLTWLMLITGTIIIILMLLLLRSKRKKTDIVLVIYQRFCRKLQPLGLTRETGEGALAFAERAKQKIPTQTAAIDNITAYFLKLRYGKQPNQDDITQFAKAVTAFKIHKTP